MKLEIKFSTQASQLLDKEFEDILEVAAIKMWETAVERAPARGEGPYATGRMRESLRVAKTGDLEYTLFCPMHYGIYNEFGTGPKGKATGAVPEMPDDPYNNINYHSGEVLVTRANGVMLDEPYVRHTRGMQANPFIRPALIAGKETLIKLMKEKLG